MKTTLILTAMLALTATTGIIATAQSADAGCLSCIGFHRGR